MSAAPTSATIPFEITAWEPAPWDERDDGPALARITVRKRYAGALVGTGAAVVLTTQGPRGNGYVASERVEGELEGRAGTFVLQHGGLTGPDGADARAFGSVVPGSGTGALASIAGEATFAHDADGARLVLVYTL